MLKYVISFILFNIAQIASAQVEMADGFRSEGKIYVVIAVILILLAGFFFLLFKLDKRAKRLEEEIGEK